MKWCVHKPENCQLGKQQPAHDHHHEDKPQAKQAQTSTLKLLQKLPWWQLMNDLLAMVEPSFTALLQAIMFITTIMLITNIGIAFFYAWVLFYKLQQHAPSQRRQERLHSLALRKHRRRHHQQYRAGIHLNTRSLQHK
jgi:hypothetical protein